MTLKSTSFLLFFYLIIDRPKEKEKEKVLGLKGNREHPRPNSVFGWHKFLGLDWAQNGFGPIIGPKEMDWVQ